MRQRPHEKVHYQGYFQLGNEIFQAFGPHMGRFCTEFEQRLEPSSPHEARGALEEDLSLTIMDPEMCQFGSSRKI